MHLLPVLSHLYELLACSYEYFSNHVILLPFSIRYWMMGAWWARQDQQNQSSLWRFLDGGMKRIIWNETHNHQPSHDKWSCVLLILCPNEIQHPLLQQSQLCFLFPVAQTSYWCALFSNNAAILFCCYHLLRSIYFYIIRLLIFY